MKNKKTLIAIIAIIAVLALPGIYFVAVKTLPMGKILSIFDGENDEYGDAYDEAIDVLNNKIPTEIILCGEDMIFREGVNCKRIDEITEETMKTDKGYTMLIVNDMNGTVSFTEEEIEYLKQRKKDDTFYFYYCGTANIPLFDEHGIFTNIWMEGDLCTAMVTLEGDRTEYGGIYTEQLKAIDDNCGKEDGMQELIFMNILDCYKWNNM